MSTIKQIPKQFSGIGEVGPYEFFLHCKTDRGFCYEVRLNNIVSHYEVFRFKVNKRFACISYPSSRGFGIWAWTFFDQNKALSKLNSL